MEKNAKKVLVCLTSDARTSLRGHPIEPFVEHDHWFPCASVEQNGYFLDMKVVFDQEPAPVVVEISIPLQHVAAIVSGEGLKRVGFQTSS